MPLRPLGNDCVRIQTVVSTISNGTERANISGDPNIHIDSSRSTQFPRYLGYSSAGIIIEKGEKVKSVEIGDRVAVHGGFHSSINTLNENAVVKLPSDSVSFETAALSYISTFPLAAIRKTHIEMGESSLVVGVGLLGVLAIKLLKAAGSVPVIAADIKPKRRKIALENGADFAFDPNSESFAEDVKKVCGGGVNVAIEVTGVGAGFNKALDCMARFGRVSLLGCTRNSDFTVDYYRKIHAPGITVIGAHSKARPEVESHSGFFTKRDDIKTILNLVAGGRLCLENIIEETHSPADCFNIYNRLVNDKNFPIAVQFDWKKL